MSKKIAEIKYFTLAETVEDEGRTEGDEYGGESEDDGEDDDEGEKYRG